ncbi:MAG: SRPBCC domain-containing protein [Lapillicoccus sp.]
MSDPASSETVDGKPEAHDVVEVDTVLQHPVAHVWRVLTTNDGAQALLGSGARLGGKGETWHAEDGSHGVWRSYHPMEQVRVSWHADADAPRSLVDLHLAPEGDATRVSLRHDLGGSGGPDGAAMQQRWSSALDRLDALAT